MTLAQSFGRVLTWNKPGPRNREAVIVSPEIFEILHVLWIQLVAFARVVASGIAVDLSRDVCERVPDVEALA